MYLLLTLFGVSPGGLFSGEFEHAPWSFAKLLNGLGHLPLPIIVIGMAGTAAIIRVMRGTLLDELRKQYVITARAKGVSETALTFKYPVRVALNPIISTVGWLLPEIVSGSTHRRHRAQPAHRGAPAVQRPAPGGHRASWYWSCSTRHASR